VADEGIGPNFFDALMAQSGLSGASNHLSEAKRTSPKDGVMPAPKQQRERPIGSDWTELAQTLIDVRSCCKPSRSNQHIIALHQIPLRSAR
jgi:hypothetical protein